jgi:hypothetical protein
MTISKSLSNNIKSPNGNSLALFLDDNDSLLKLKDIYGNIEALSNYVGGLENVGGEKELYINGTSSPSQIRTLKQGANISLTQNADTIEISAANATGVPLYYGSFYDTTTQTTTGGEQKAMTLNNTILSNGISVVNNSQIKVANAGIYNLQFSAQILKTQGGMVETMYIYLRKNGINIPDSNTAISLANNSTYIVASWNFVESLNANQYLELMWYTTDQHIQIQRITNPIAGLPNIPSLIVTMNRVG